MKKIIEEVKQNPLTPLYYIQGHINWWIHGRAIKKYWKKINECKECFETNQCQSGCSCPFNQVALSSKKCLNKK